MYKQITTGILFLGLVAALAGCGGSDTKPAGSAPASAPAAGANSGGTVVNLKNTKFDKAKLEVTAGTTVKWVNQDTVDHSVYEGEPDSGKYAFKSKDISKGGEFTHTFDKAGTYEIFCNTGGHHLLGMKMQVIVK